MSLNCLSCQLLQRSDSDRDYDQQQQRQQHEQIYCSDQYDSPERSWSGNLSFQSHNRENRGGFRARPENKVPPMGHRRLHTTGAISFSGGGKEPRLIRSSGMRRDWSFEDLRTIGEEKEQSDNS